MDLFELDPDEVQFVLGNFQVLLAICISAADSTCDVGVFRVITLHAYCLKRMNLHIKIKLSGSDVTKLPWWHSPSSSLLCGHSVCSSSG